VLHDHTTDVAVVHDLFHLLDDVLPLAFERLPHRFGLHGIFSDSSETKDPQTGLRTLG